MKGENLIFVRNLPYDLESEGLEELFSDIGPVKRAFVIKTGLGGESRGFGYVQFALKEDCLTAIEKMDKKDYRGRKLGVSMADKKGGKKEVNSNSTSTPFLFDDEDEDDTKKKKVAIQDIIMAKNEKKEGIQKKNKTSSSDELIIIERKQKAAQKALTLVIFNLKDSVSLDDIQAKVSKFGCLKVEWPVKRSSVTTVMKGDDNSSVASLLFSDKLSINLALQKMDGKELLGSKLLSRKLSTICETKQSKDACRLIVRNLSWKVKVLHLQEEFVVYGPISQVHIPLKEDGKSRGFGFVQFLCANDAATALVNINGKDILGRVVAVDFVVPKIVEEKKDGVKKEDEGNEEEEMEEDNEVESGVEEKGDNGDDTREKKEEEEEEEEEGEVGGKPLDDVAEEKTVFIRNLGFRTETKSIFDAFVKFGFIEYVKIVSDKVTGSSLGTAFVKFKLQESAMKAISASNTEPVKDIGRKGKRISLADATEGIVVDGRVLSVTLAVNKNEASRLMDANKLKKEDKRHLYLASEGRITEDSDVGKEMPKADLQKRQRAMAEKKTKLVNTLFFVSPIRLSIRNLNKIIDDKKLRAAALYAAKEGMKAGLVRENEGDLSLRPLSKNPPIVLKQALIVVDKEKGKLSEKSGKPQGESKGFGFVEFSEHIHALACLRFMNNNPRFSYMCPRGDGIDPGDSFKIDANHKMKSRPIVEFSTENHMALQKQEKRKTLIEAAQSRKKKLQEIEKANKEAEEAEESSGNNKDKKKRKRKDRREEKEEMINKKQKKAEKKAEKREREVEEKEIALEEERSVKRQRIQVEKNEDKIKMPVKEKKDKDSKIRNLEDSYQAKSFFGSGGGVEQVVKKSRWFEE